MIRKGESDNQYDRNAIAVYASVGSGIAEPHRQKKRQAHISELALWNYATLSDVYSTTAISVIRLLTVLQCHQVFLPLHR